MSEKKTFYITTPIYYVNAKPHIGSLYSTLLADVFARYFKTKRYDVKFVTGTDEHGQKVDEAAQKEGLHPQEFVNQLVPHFESTWKDWRLDYDIFIRTTSASHKKAVKVWIEKMISQGDIYKGSYEGWYSVASEAFLTEKDIEFRDEEGAPVCPTSGKKAVWISQDAYFFKLSKYQDQLLAFYKKHSDWIVPKNRLQEVISFVDSGLKDLCISRPKESLSWGIPFPSDEDHVVYVWADALNNYISAIGYGDENKNQEFNSFWPCDLHVLGKDIVKFHAVFWPAFLMATGLELPKNMLVHGWILVDEQKMSKSLGNAIDPEYLLKKYGRDRSRYYLARHIVITQDSSFSYQDLEEKTNAELSHALGNLLQRVVSLAYKYEYTSINGIEGMGEAEKDLHEKLKSMKKSFEYEMSLYSLHKAYGHVWHFISDVNAYVHNQEPWKVVKQDKKRFEAVISTALHAVWSIATCVWPLMPDAAENIHTQLGYDFSQFDKQFCLSCIVGWQKKFNLQKPRPLFPIIEGEGVCKVESENIKKNKDSRVEEEKKESQVEVSYVDIDHVMAFELRVGKVIDVEEIPKSDKLYKMSVDFGEFGIKTVCAGIKEFYSIDEVKGIKSVFAYNLAPRKLRGILSHGMMMMAKDKDNKPTFVKIGDSVEAGTRLQ